MHTAASLSVSPLIYCFVSLAFVHSFSCMHIQLCCSLTMEPPELSDPNPYENPLINYVLGQVPQCHISFIWYEYKPVKIFQVKVKLKICISCNGLYEKTICSLIRLFRSYSIRIFDFQKILSSMPSLKKRNFFYSYFYGFDQADFCHVYLCNDLSLTPLRKSPSRNFFSI